ncbi:uncharacterized mitochondrial protein AtMg00810-like [Solanum lycopersicum]|uniref:uncharacterized mitochondrial protein AtMg00810-like n=1 Tax=Solanum lycopersicum TaxID=4081 RepID=UPI00374A2064
MVSLRTMLTLAATKGWDVQQIDVYNAFLQSDLVEEVYMQLPPGCTHRYDGVQPALLAVGFQQSHMDYSLFTKRSDEGIVIVLIYVDDLLVTGRSLKLINETKTVLKDNFKIKDLGTLRYFLGIEFARNTKGILMHQRKYALEIISHLGLGGSKPIATPVETNVKLTTMVFDKHVGSSSDSLLSDIGAYQRLVGRLIYLTITRPDLSYAVQSLSQFMNAPKRYHMDAAVRVVRYIKQNPGSGILLAAQSSDYLQAYCDADWGSCLDTRKSITGYMVKFGDSLLSWKSKKQSTVSRSSAEAKYRNMTSTVSEVTWIIGLFRGLDMPLTLHVVIHNDSTAAIQIASNPVFHERTKHIDIDCHFVREKIQRGIVFIQHLATAEQLADVLTKGRGRLQHDYLVSKLGMKNIFISPSLKEGIEEYAKSIAKN